MEIRMPNKTLLNPLNLEASLELSSTLQELETLQRQLEETIQYKAQSRAEYRLKQRAIQWAKSKIASLQVKVKKLKSRMSK